MERLRSFIGFDESSLGEAVEAKMEESRTQWKEEAVPQARGQTP